MSYENLTVRRDGHVQIIGLDRPAKRNAFNSAMLRELAAAIGVQAFLARGTAEFVGR